MKKAVIFGGQGSQSTNMGMDFLCLEKNQEKVAIASKILGFDVISAVKNLNNELGETRYAQPLLVLIMILMFDEYHENHQVDGFLGFSLGEYVALYASGIYDFETTMSIVNKRSQLMEEAAKKCPGKMAAILNFDEAKIVEICNQVNQTDVLVPANFNSRSQLVISGSLEGIKQGIDKLKFEGAKRIVELNVSGGFHSPLMQDAGKKLKNYLLTKHKNKNSKPVYLNTTAKQLVLSDLESELEKQIQSPVYFYQSIEQMIDDGFQFFVEIGPGKVLSQLIKRNYSDVIVKNICELNDLDNGEGDI